MPMKMINAEFMGMSEEWLAGYEAAKADLGLTCLGCKHDAWKDNDRCLMCVRGTFDMYEAKEEE